MQYFKTFFFIPGHGCHRGVSLSYEGGSQRPILKIKISLTLTSKPTSAHTFLRTLGDVQPDKKRSIGVSAAFISPAASEHLCQASTVTQWKPTREARSPIVPRRKPVFAHAINHKISSVTPLHSLRFLHLLLALLLSA